MVVRCTCIPRSGPTEIVGLHDGALKIRVAAPPVDGRATEAARVALASALGVGAAAVTLVSGERSRLKCFRVGGHRRDRRRAAASPVSRPAARVNGRPWAAGYNPAPSGRPSCHGRPGSLQTSHRAPTIHE